mmetsp:Transcript_11929/g.28894  ORF Transcript_11929/g.28894 Transcript_11929/m.28894 type:complete len:378 (-) Transcript_11929:284-1417(-)
MTFSPSMNMTCSLPLFPAGAVEWEEVSLEEVAVDDVFLEEVAVAAGAEGAAFDLAPRPRCLPPTASKSENLSSPSFEEGPGGEPPLSFSQSSNSSPFVLGSSASAAEFFPPVLGGAERPLPADICAPVWLPPVETASPPWFSFFMRRVFVLSLAFVDSSEECTSSPSTLDSSSSFSSGFDLSSLSECSSSATVGIPVALVPSSGSWSGSYSFVCFCSCRSVSISIASSFLSSIACLRVPGVNFMRSADVMLAAAGAGPAGAVDVGLAGVLAASFPVLNRLTELRPRAVVEPLPSSRTTVPRFTLALLPIDDEEDSRASGKVGFVRETGFLDDGFGTEPVAAAEVFFSTMSARCGFLAWTGSFAAAGVCFVNVPLVMR